MQRQQRGDINLDFWPKSPITPVRWQVEKNYINYPTAVEFMQHQVEQIVEKKQAELVWLIEHPPLYTAGTSAKTHDLLRPDDLPIYQTGRGGQYTYHGPGQRIAYIMLDLRQRCTDIRAFVAILEQWIINTLDEFGIQGERREDRVGVWVNTKEGEKKIAALGIKIRHWVSFHGIAINLNPQLEYYKGIVPCGQRDFGVTSFAELGHMQNMQQLDEALELHFVKLFGPKEV